MTRRGAVTLAAVLLASVATVAAEPASSTRCVFGGPVPGFRAMQVALPDGSDFLTLELHGERIPRALVDDSGWHLAEGLVVLDAATGAIAAHQVLNAGTAPPVLVASNGDVDVRQAVVAPEGPWIHSSRKMAVSLPPGQYVIVAFGVGGPATGALAQHWGASIYLEGTHSCGSAVPGTTFDFDHTDFDGDQVYVPGAGIAQDVTLSFEPTRPLVVGLLDAGFQGEAVGEMTVDHDLAGTTGTVEREIVPFVSTAGTHRLVASYRGLYPVVNVAGATIELAVPGVTP